VLMAFVMRVQWELAGYVPEVPEPAKVPRTRLMEASV
jgi:cell division protein FtsW